MRNPDRGGLRQRLRRIARQVDAQHHSLHSFQEALSDAVEASPAGGARLACAHYRDALLAHFDLEERLFFPALHGFDRDTEPILVELQNGHDILRREIEQVQTLIAADAEEASSALEALLARLHAHEQREQALWKLTE